MCKIVILKKGQMLPFDKLQNAVWNNWHSYGIVVKGPKKFDIFKKVADGDDGEISADEIQDILAKNQEFDRFLHVRHNTAGATDEGNTHPMTVYRDKHRQVEFMHNGTLYEYKSKKPSADGKSLVDDDSGPSDTRNFADEVLIPYLKMMKG